MTDNEITKALECCSKDEINGLNVFTYGGVPMRSLLRYALDLINRLKAENKRLSTLAQLGNTRANDYRVMRDRALKAEAENERLKIENAELKGYKTTDWLIRGISPEQLEHEKIQAWKAEAYKEFAELLKTKKHECGCNYRKKPVYAILVEKIDETYKELVGKDK